MGDGEQVETVEPASAPAARLTGADAVKAHVTLVLGLALCGAAFAFEIRRALGGNSLSWAYVFEWPLLGGFAVYMWWKVMHPGGDTERRREASATRQIAPEFDGMLNAWQAHQAEMAERSGATPPESEAP